jgi:hypothetical protein
LASLGLREKSERLAAVFELGSFKYCIKIVFSLLEISKAELDLAQTEESSIVMCVETESLVVGQRGLFKVLLGVVCLAHYKVEVSSQHLHLSSEVRILLGSSFGASHPLEEP